MFTYDTDIMIEANDFDDAERKAKLLTIDPEKHIQTPIKQEQGEYFITAITFG